MRLRNIPDPPLNHIAPFNEFPKRELDAIVSSSTRRSFEAARTVARQGQFGDEILIVLSGAGVAAIGGTNVGMVGSGDMIGDLALLGNKPHTTTITATTPLEALGISIPMFDRLVRSAPSLLRAIACNMARRLYDAEHARFNDARARLDAGGPWPYEAILDRPTVTSNGALHTPMPLEADRLAARAGTRV